MKKELELHYLDEMCRTSQPLKYRILVEDQCVDIQMRLCEWAGATRKEILEIILKYVDPETERTQEL